MNKNKCGNETIIVSCVGKISLIYLVDFHIFRQLNFTTNIFGEKA